MKLTDELQSEFLAALSHPNRLRIVEMLRDGELCQCKFPEALGIEQSNLSRHIKTLISAGVLASRREGVKILLSVSDPRIFDLIDTIGEILRRQVLDQATVLEQQD